MSENYNKPVPVLKRAAQQSAELIAKHAVKRGAPNLMVDVNTAVMLPNFIRLAARILRTEYAMLVLPNELEGYQVITHGIAPERIVLSDMIQYEAIESGRFLNVPDARNSFRYSKAPHVASDPGFVFHISYPLHIEQSDRPGALCWMSNEPRLVSQDEMTDCRHMSKLVEGFMAMQDKSLHDELTGLMNRRAATIRIREEWRRVTRNLKPITFVMFDLDHFKALNDNLGHAEGDIALKQFADILEKRLKRVGDSVSRFGGEEFLAMLPFTDESEALKLIENIRSDLRNAKIKNPGGINGVLTCSAGISISRSYQHFTLNKPEDFIKAADNALYEAKDHGRDCSVVANNIEELFSHIRGEDSRKSNGEPNEIKVAS